MGETLYANIVNVLEYYLGPAAPRFVDRQIESHFNKAPQEIQSEDVAQFTEWVRVSLAILTEDTATVDECTQKLLKLI